MYGLLHRLQRWLRGPEEEPPATTETLEVVQRLTKLPVRNAALYEQALTHRSLLRGRPDSHLHSNERLEFLGDAVLGFIVAAYLYEHFPDRNEGFLTRLRAKLVNREALAQAARRLKLGTYVRLSENMERVGGRENDSILSDAFEALVGALYLDLGLEATRAFVERVLLEPLDLEALARRPDNYKSLLLEFAQARGWPQPRYRVVAEEGPSHARTFTVEAWIGNRRLGRGTAGSKKQAEQQAAREALARLQAAETLEGGA
ncbi:ribonuclease III [Rhodothermus profundi]|uniref:Ribonuclease 3 n=1 Tax=Rhodothermus profundi TaxID=633813 RepID=A0A1M6W159_9BACT|nr:ribonuclease III [Rhodothermus profundi]SHK87356.1 RNAse III [Rhodothermus profundi]